MLYPTIELSRAEDMRATERRPCSQICDCVAHVALRDVVNDELMMHVTQNLHHVVGVLLEDRLYCLRILAHESFQALFTTLSTK